MTYAVVTKSNVLYQPRENLKTLIKNNLSNQVEIYSYFPNQKAANFKGYPFIVIPDPSLLEEDEKTLYSDIKEHTNSVDGSIFHSVLKLGDGKLRTVKQEIFETLCKKSNEKILNGYAMSDLNIDIDESSERQLIDQNELIEIPFSITFSTEVNFS